VKEVAGVATRQPVLTVTLNAALDVTYNARRFVWGDQNRVEAVHRRAGGKGVNVARVLEQLGVGALVTGFAGGPTGEAIRRSLQAGGFQERLLEITAESRSTVVTVSEADGLVTTFDEPGPTVSSTEWERFLATRRFVDAEVVPRHEQAASGPRPVPAAISVPLRPWSARQRRLPGRRRGTKPRPQARSTRPARCGYGLSGWAYALPEFVVYGR